MRRYSRQNLSGFLSASGASMAVALFFFMLGISIGIFTELMMENSEKASVISYLEKYFLLNNTKELSFSGIFFNSAANNLGLLLIIILSGLTAIGFPVALAALTYKGMALGFSAALLIDSMSYKGLALVFTSMVPQNLILIPSLIVAGIIALNMAFLIISNRSNGIKKNLMQNAGSYLFIAMILTMAVLGGCLIESFISPILTQLVV